ncbi:hypothetical protein BpHYR1_051883 [Brachionus plicatilis]|uniref:Uncharacterized protein n=1 Tax=Brachionus plicatilis TaxID=10195 RepID=A0A3M7RMC3_BRAPC|nr:hypothetical protein BpHYR1_051883 [Brachionus plicatilis]
MKTSVRYIRTCLYSRIPNYSDMSLKSNNCFNDRRCYKRLQKYYTKNDIAFNILHHDGENKLQPSIVLNLLFELNERYVMCTQNMKNSLSSLLNYLNLIQKNEISAIVHQSQTKIKPHCIDKKN